MAKSGMPRDPVCGKRMNRNKAHAMIRHEGVEYLICCPKCQSEFEANPDAYVRSRWNVS